MKDRIFMSDHGFYVDRTKPHTVDGIKGNPVVFEECDPCDVVDELEARVE